MCHNHRTVHACGHDQTHVTLCKAALAPLILRATTFPYLQDLPQTRSLGHHDVSLTSAHSEASCTTCCQAPLDAKRTLRKGHGIRERDLAVNVPEGLWEWSTRLCSWEQDVKPRSSRPRHEAAIGDRDYRSSDSHDDRTFYPPM